MNTFGECSCSIGGRQRILRGELELELAGLETAVDANMDGSVYQTAKTSACIAKVTLEDEADVEITATDMITAQDVTIAEDSNGRSHLFSAAKIVGKPVYNPATGALSGISFACARADYKRLT